MSKLSQFFGGGGGGAPQYYEEIAVSGTWTKPIGITTFFVEVFGGTDGRYFGEYKAKLLKSDQIPDSLAVTVSAASSSSITLFGELLSSSGGARIGVGANVWGYGYTDPQWRTVTGSSPYGGIGFARITGW